MNKSLSKEWGSLSVASDNHSPRTHISIRDLSKRFAEVTLYDHFNLNIGHGKIVSVFGPNGCGKSTLINMMSGILPMDAGTVQFDGKSIRDTRIGYVFQNYREAIFPWLRAIDNLRYPLQFLPLTRRDRENHLERLLTTFDVTIDLKRYPYEMSGGQQQLISIMRAMITDPEVLFLDEPFSALDFEMTMFLREKLEHALVEKKITTLLVSHDLDEAVYFADEILLLTKKPAQVAARIPFDAPRPRTVESGLTAEFIKAKSETLAIFQHEARK